MKFIVIIFLSLQIFNPLTAQDNPFDSRLLEVYDEPYLERLENQSIQLLELLNFELDNGFIIYKILGDKKIDFSGTVDINTEDFNFLKLVKDGAINQAQNKNQYYKIKNKDQVLVVYSKNELVKLFNRMQHSQ